MPIRAHSNLPKGLRLLTDGVYMIDLRLADGRRFRERTGKSRKVAEKRLNQIRGELAEERFFPDLAINKRRAGLMLKDAWEKHFLPSKERTKTYKETVRTGKFFLEFFGPETPVVDIRPVDIENWRLGEMKRGLKIASVNRPLAILRSFFNYLISLERLEKSPMANLKLEDPKNERDRQATPEEFIALAGEMKPEEFSIVGIAVHTGMRKGEMFPLEWTQVDLTRRLITLETTKNGRPRSVPISDSCLELLQGLPSRLKSRWLFPNKSGTGPMDAHNFRARVFQKACKKAGIKNLTWHDLRRTFASLLLQCGMSTRTIQQLLGQRDPRMVQRYAYQHQGGLLQAVNCIGELGKRATDTPMDTNAGTGTFGPSQEMTKP